MHAEEGVLGKLHVARILKRGWGAVLWWRREEAREDQAGLLP